MRVQLIWLLCAALAATPAVTPKPPAPWEHVLRWLDSERQRMVQDLAAAHAVLLSRAHRENRPDLALRLSEAAPAARPAGYGVLPEILDDPAHAPAPLRETRYSLDVLSASFPRDVRDTALLAARVAAEPKLPLAAWVDEFERLRGRLRTVEDHLGYHAWWQAAVAEHREYFRGRQRLADLARRLSDLGTAGDQAAAAEVRRQLRQQSLGPVRAAGLALERRADGTAVLPVSVVTDIDDERFLTAFQSAVEAEYSGSAAAKALKFRLDLRLERVSPGAIYPEGAPRRGTPIDVAAHRARFAQDALVLTTGAESTYAWQGRSILLGPSPVTRRTLAHEFGHLLGFDDGYVRVYEGDSQGAFGVVLVEWSGLSDDLMADPVGGHVTDTMIRALLETYTKNKTVD